MLSTLLAMAVVICAWIVLFTAIAGIGVLCTSSLRYENNPLPWRITDLFWVGFAGTVGFLILWHLFLPVDWRVTCIILLVGLCSHIALPEHAINVLRGLHKWHPLLIICGVLTLLWLSNRSLDIPSHYDSGLYHFPTIKWTNEFAAVPGLGNLHCRLAYNQSYFLYVAILNASPFGMFGHVLANGLLLIGLITRLLGSAARAVTRPRGITPAILFQCLLLPIAVHQGGHVDLPSPSPDQAMFIIGAMVFIWLIEYLEIRSVDARASWVYALLLCVLAITVVTMKLNIIFYAALLLLCVFGVEVWYAWERGYDRLKKLTSNVVLLSAIFGVPWAVTGVIISGYIGYPCTLFGFHVDWRVPHSIAQDDANWIRSWARQGSVHWSQVLDNLDWVGPWSVRMLHEMNIVVPLVLITIGLLLVVGALFYRTTEVRKKSWLWIPFIPLLGSLVFWFFTAPARRFAGCAFWSLGVWSIAVPIIIFGWHEFRRVVRFIPVILLVVSLGGAAIKAELVNDVGNRGLGTIPAVDVKECKTDSGLKLYVPMVGNRSWYAPLPSTPYPKKDLTLRGKSLHSGFKLPQTHTISSQSFRQR